MTDTNGTERLSDVLDRQPQELLLAVVASVWASEGWRVTQVDDTWLRALKDGEVRHLLVVTSGFEHLFGTDSSSADTPVTVVYTGDTARDLSWPGSGQTTVLDAPALARRCLDAGVAAEILDVLRPESGWYLISSVRRRALVLVPLQAGLMVFWFREYLFSESPSAAVGVFGLVLTAVLSIALSDILFVDDTLGSRLVAVGSVIGGVGYAGSVALGVAVSGIGGATLTVVVVLAAARAVVALEQRTSVDLLYRLLPRDSVWH